MTSWAARADTWPSLGYTSHLSLLLAEATPPPPARSPGRPRVTHHIVSTGCPRAMRRLTQGQPGLRAHVCVYFWSTLSKGRGAPALMGGVVCGLAWATQRKKMCSLGKSDTDVGRPWACLRIHHSLGYVFINVAQPGLCRRLGTACAMRKDLGKMDNWDSLGYVDKRKPGPHE